MLAYISIIVHLTISPKSYSDFASKTNSILRLYFRIVSCIDIKFLLSKTHRLQNAVSSSESSVYDRTPYSVSDANGSVQILISRSR